MDFGKSFSYMFDDEEWVSKVLIGALFNILAGILIGIPFLMGYMVELVANVRKGVAKPLPRWDNLGQKFADGLMLTIALFIYALPIFIVMIPYLIVVAAAGGNEGDGVVTLFTLCFICVAVVWGLIVAALTPAITIRFAETRDFGAMFHFGDLFRFTGQHLGQVIVAILLGWVAAFIGSIVGLILCIVGVLATSFWAMLVQYHLYGQIGLPSVTPPSAPETAPTA